MSWAKLRRALPWLVLAGSFLVLCVFEWRNVTDLLDSDMASDMIYANLLAKEGSFLSTSWYYSTELRIIHNHLFFAPFFHLTQDWHLVRFLGTLVSYVLFELSLGMLARQLGLWRRFPLIGAVLLLPLSSLHFLFNLVGNLYTAYLILTFLLLALALAQSAPCTPRARAWRLAALSALSAAAGLGGYRFLYLFSLPLAAAALYLRLRHGPVPRVSRLLGGSVLSLGMALLGAALNRLVLARVYSFASYDAMAFTDFSFARIGDFLSRLPTLLGFPTNQPVLSLYAAPAALSLLLLALACWSVLSALRAPRGALGSVQPEDRTPPPDRLRRAGSGPVCGLCAGLLPRPAGPDQRGDIPVPLPARGDPVHPAGGLSAGSPARLRAAFARRAAPRRRSAMSRRASPHAARGGGGGAGVPAGGDLGGELPLL